MIKTLTIDNREVTFKSTAGTPLRYKQQFGSDFFADMLKLNALSDIDDPKNMTREQIESIDFEAFYNILWAMAKTNDPNLPDPLSWLDTFDEFPIIDILPEVQDLLMKNLELSKKK